MPTDPKDEPKQSEDVRSERFCWGDESLPPDWKPEDKSEEDNE